MARIGEDRRIHVVEPVPAVPDTPEPLIVPERWGAPSRPDTPVPDPAPAE